jgi:isopentenyl diphosphate isomerase/L-lactate dehydrogenase-like FMN-dependent dehydrogenase
MPTAVGPQRQAEIYRAGLAGQKPLFPIAFEDLAREAKERMKPEAYMYVAGGAGHSDTMRANRAAFERWRIVPRFLRDVSQRDLRINLLGQTYPAPLLLAPVGVQGIIHKEGELAVARAAKTLGVPMVLSTVSSHSIEDVATTLGDSPRWFQLYWPADRELALSFVRRAEQAGYTALVVTLDTFMLAWREGDLQNAYLPFLYGEGMANYTSDPVFRQALLLPPAVNPIPPVAHFLKVAFNPTLTWNDIAFLKQNTKLPILLKGILDPEDARKAVDFGVAGLLVSNHGGRQVDGAIAALDALPRIADAVGDKLALLFDSGIRRGSDIFKALALGARAVLVGRPYCYGLALGGEEGVKFVLHNLLADFDLTLGLAGCRTVAEVTRERLHVVQ